MEIINLNGQLVTDSRDIAEMVGRPHDNVLKDVLRIITQLGDVKVTSPTLFNHLTQTAKTKS